jgi:hypothetical protein
MFAVSASMRARLTPKRPADVAQRAAAPVADHRRGQRRALAAVAPVDVLDHLLAPLVLEVDVDVRRLVALARDEALEQHAGARRVHRGDAERVADRRVRGRAAALAQDAAFACETDDVVHRQEVGLVAEVGDDRELVLDLRADLFRCALRPALAAALLDQPAQPGPGPLAGRDRIDRVLVADLVQPEPATRGHPQRLGEPARRIQAGQLVPGAQAALAVREQRWRGLRHRFFEAQRSERVLQRAPAAHVHVHVPAGEHRDPGGDAQGGSAFPQRRVVGGARQCDGEAQPLRRHRPPEARRPLAVP